MLIHASEAETLNSIRLALEREEQQIRVNDSTGEVYDITISRSAPYASPVISRATTPSNAQLHHGDSSSHPSTTSGGHRILRLPQLVSKRAHAHNTSVPSASFLDATSHSAASTTNGDKASASSLQEPTSTLASSTNSPQNGSASPLGVHEGAQKSQSSFTAPTRHHPFLSELPPSPPLEADYVAGSDSRNGLITSFANGGQKISPGANSSGDAVNNVAAGSHTAATTQARVPIPRRAYTSDLSQLQTELVTSPSSSVLAAGAVSHSTAPTNANSGVSRPMLIEDSAQVDSPIDASVPFKPALQQRRNFSSASTASTAYRTASSNAGSESEYEDGLAATSGAIGSAESSRVGSSSKGSAVAAPAIRLTHDTSPYLHPEYISAEAGPSANGPVRAQPVRRNTTGSSLQSRRGQPTNSLGQAAGRRSSRERETFGSSSSGQPWLGGDALNSPSMDTPNLALRTGDAAFDEEAAKHAEQLRRNRRYKEQKARDAAADGTATDADAAMSGGGVVGALTRSKTGRDWRLKERDREAERGDEDLGEPKVLVGNLVGEGHANYVLMYNMLTGIRIGVSRCQAKMKRPLNDADFKARHKFTFDIIGNELTPSAKYDFKFKDYAPWVFRELREHFHLDAADYLLSLTSKYILSELGSPGKSGSFFYFSRDYRFIIKTIRHSEHKFLLRILKDYHEHVKANPHTLLSRFYGLHRVKLPHGRKIHFVIMNNLFPPHRDIHETYDLKGSSIGREYPEDKAAAKKGAVLKDLNWLKRGREIELGPEKRAMFEAQLKSDVALLQRLNIMDYSLLIGLHDMRRGNKENIRQDNLHVFQPDTKELKRQPTQVKRPGAGSGSEKDASALRQAVRRSDPKALNAQQMTKLPDKDVSERRHFVFYQDEGGFRSTDEHNQPGHMIYYLGVIDLFTPYTSVKRGETIWKGLTQNRHMISSVPPKEYGQRFYDFLCSVIKGGDKSRRPKMWGFPPKKEAEAK
ncbi:SAICAR synthase-like protein, partial [Testicularia cyperi]